MSELECACVHVCARVRVCVRAGVSVCACVCSRVYFLIYSHSYSFTGHAIARQGFGLGYRNHESEETRPTRKTCTIGASSPATMQT